MPLWTSSAVQRCQVSNLLAYMGRAAGDMLGQAKIGGTWKNMGNTISRKNTFFGILVESRSWRDRNLKFGPNCDLEVDNLEKNKKIGEAKPSQLLLSTKITHASCQSLNLCTVFRYSAKSVLPQSTERQSLVSKVEADEKSKENEALGEAGETKRKQLLAKKREILVHVPNCQSSQLPVVNVLKHMKKKPKQLGTKKRKIIVQVPSCQCSEP